MTISSYIVSVASKPAWGMIINAKSAGQAKSEYHRHVTDAWPDVPFTALRCHKNGAPHTSPDFARNAKYRGLPNIKCGDRVKVGEARSRHRYTPPPANAQKLSSARLANGGMNDRPLRRG